VSATQSLSALPQQDSAQLWQADVFGGLELLRAQLIKFAFSPHAHEEFMIAITEGGVGAPQFWGGSTRVGPDNVVVLNPGVVHSGGPAPASMWCWRTFYIPVPLMQRMAQELTGGDRGVPYFARNLISDPYAVAMLTRAHLALEKPESALGRESFLLEALASLLAHHAAKKVNPRPIGSENRAVARAKEILEALPGENVSLETLAREANLSPFHLCRVFRRETGLSPHEYQVLVRARLAKTHLANGLPISQAAVEAGFFDQAHLTRHFKRIFGVTPGQYLSGLFH